MSADPLEEAIQAIPRTGWMLLGLSRSPFDSVEPWTCDLVPGHFGSYQWGKKAKSGPWTVYPNAQARVIASGATPLEAVRNAMKELDKSPARQVYLDLERAFEDALDGRLQTT